MNFVQVKSVEYYLEINNFFEIFVRGRGTSKIHHFKYDL